VVHAGEGTELTLAAAHAVQRGSVDFGRHIFHLALADAVLAGAGAVHGESALVEAFNESANARDLLGIVHIDQDADMKIAVAHMADDRCQQFTLGDVPLRLRDSFRPSRTPYP